MKQSKLGPSYTFAVGDIHGSDAALARLLEACSQ
jgi:hypothetical protein